MMGIVITRAAELKSLLRIKIVGRRAAASMAPHSLTPLHCLARCITKKASSSMTPIFTISAV